MLVIITKKGMMKKLNEDTIRAMGREARGLRCIGLKENDEVVGVVHIPTETGSPVSSSQKLNEGDSNAN